MLTSYLAVDPGRVTGFAEFAPFGRLMRCGLVKGDDPTGIPRGVPLLIIERPHGGEGKASRTDLVKLSRRMERLILHVGAAKVIEYEPRRWKGTVKKSIMTRRIWEKWIHPEEKLVMRTRNHNAIDAVGLGIWYAAILGLRELEWAA